MTSQEPTENEEALAEAKEELARRLEEACQTSTGGNVPETTGELLRLEDALHAATKATEEMLAARKRELEAAAERSVSGGQATATDHEVPLEHGRERIREFRDSKGQEWRVWAVTPGMASQTSQRHLGELRNGWLAFEALTGTGRRRLVAFPQDWMDGTDEQLEELLDRAAVAPVRKRPEAGA
jgi:hypothetical protein